MQSIATQRARGVSRVQAQGQSAEAILNELTGEFVKFKERNNAVLDDLAAQIAANRVGGVGGDDGDVKPSVKAARAELGAFVRSGLIPMAAMSTDDGSSGGYLVQPELEKTITRRQADISPMRTLARVVTSRSGEYQIPIATGGVDSGWVGERQSRPETDGPPLALLTITAQEIYANPSVTQRLLDDSVENIGNYLSEEIALAFDEKEGDAFVNGNGVNKPRGFLQYSTAATADATRPFGTLQFDETAGSGVIAADDLVDLVFDLRRGYRRGAAWVMNSTTASVVRKLKDAEGNHIWSLTGDAEMPRLLGYPVEIDEGMPTIATGAFPIAFGNFKRGYIIVDRTGIRLIRDDVTNKPYVQFYTTKRVGGGVYDSNAIKLMKIKA